MIPTNKTNPNGKYHRSNNTKYNTLVVLVHHLGGTPEQLKYHVRFLNQNGFDVYTYPAFLHGKSHWKEFSPIIKKEKSQVLEIWTEELKMHLNHLPGTKIIFSFSFPSAAALMAILERTDIKALICDGGPFLNLPLATWRLFTHHYHITSLFMKIYLTGKMCMDFKLLSVGKKLIRNLPHIPSHFPVLSLQSEKDRQAPPSSINKLFKIMKQAHLTVCRLKHSPHLEGLKTEKSFYIKNVIAFLKKVSSPL